MKDLNAIVKDYQGEFFIAIQTESIIREYNLVNELNNLSERLINKIGSNETTWGFQKLENALTAVSILQSNNFPFKFSGENNIQFIEDLGK